MARARDAYPDLQAIARRKVVEAGFVVDPPADVRWQLNALAGAPAEEVRDTSVRDLRDLLWLSIDEPEARDLDQVSYAEPLAGGATRLQVGLADVDTWIERRSALDRHAAANGSSVYAGIETFHMLPEVFAIERTSLVAGQDRLALVVDFVVEPDGALRSGEVYRALLRNHAPLTYDAAGGWLEGLPGALPEVDQIPGLAEQLRLQDAAMQAAQVKRRQDGALDLERTEVKPRFEGGRVVDLVVVRPNRARALVEQLMAATNRMIAAFFRERNVPWIARGQIPRDWDGIVDLAADYERSLPDEPDLQAFAAFVRAERSADPEHFAELQPRLARLLGGSRYYVVPPGQDAPVHFTLALHAYTRATAPNRRYADLVLQRLLKAAVAERPAPYTPGELETLATRCAERERAAGDVERDMLKLYAILLLQGREGEVFDAIVSGANARNVWARLDYPPVEGRIVDGAAGLEIGDRVQVQIYDTDWQRGFIDLERVG